MVWSSVTQHQASKPPCTAWDASRRLHGLWWSRAGVVERPRPGGHTGPLMPPDTTYCPLTPQTPSPKPFCFSQNKGWASHPQLPSPCQALTKCLWATRAQGHHWDTQRMIHIPSMIKLQQISTLNQPPSRPPSFVGDTSNNLTCIFNRMKCQTAVQDLNNNRLQGMAVVFP